MEALFAAAGAAAGDVSAVAVSAGPGAFTGLRVGMSAAKGFCFGWGAPLVPVPTLLALAHRFPGEGRIVCPVQDARRGEVYAALFRWSGGELARLSPDMAIAPALLPGRIPDGDVLFCGDGVAPFESLFREALGDRAILAYCDEGHPRASAVGIVGERIFRDGGGEDPRTAVPFYLRSPGHSVSRSPSITERWNPSRPPSFENGVSSAMLWDHPKSRRRCRWARAWKRKRLP